MPHSLEGASVVVIGGSSGIGLATAKAALAEGARVAITGRSADRLEAAEGQLGKRARAVALDAADEAGMREFFGTLDAVDHIFDTAGELVKDTRLEPDTAVMRPAMDTRFLGALYCAKYGAPKMRGRGSITFMSGTGALRPLEGAAVAMASCGAVEAFARALAVDLAPIRVNTIQPGFVDTPMLAGVLGAQKNEILAAVAKRLPVRHVGTPEEIADAVLFLMRNGYVTGIALPIDGGGLLV
jgi:NAD(P)-dependent dehydrogenase (short-subunit alcohol dehydrogenase family)